MVTVTSAYEAGVAVAAGADSLVVQGPAAGGDGHARLVGRRHRDHHQQAQRAQPPDHVGRLGALGLLVMVTVTSAYEAGVAVAAGSRRAAGRRR
ncbi:hypothetical protein JHV675_52080 [Mycobacterium avium subsp. hominissuis]